MAESEITNQLIEVLQVNEAAINFLRGEGPAALLEINIIKTDTAQKIGEILAEQTIKITDTDGRGSHIQTFTRTQRKDKASILFMPDGSDSYYRATPDFPTLRFSSELVKAEFLGLGSPPNATDMTPTDSLEWLVFRKKSKLLDWVEKSISFIRIERTAYWVHVHQAGSELVTVTMRHQNCQ